MLSGIIFILIGLLLVFLEFFLPGGIMGVAGGLIVAVGLVLFAANAQSLTLILLVFAASILALVFLARFALKRIKKTHGTMYLSQDQEGYKASSWLEELVEKEGEVVANLKPSGHITLEGKRYQAVSKMGYLERGTKIIVIGGSGAHLIVKKKEHS